MSYHYLAVYDHHTREPLYLGRAKRIATRGQRIMLHDKDRGCTHPGCTAPGYASEVHHVEEWDADLGETNIDKLTFGCWLHHPLIKPGGWKTRKRKDGRTEWIPPPHLDWGHLPLAGDGQDRVNHYHHPEEYLTGGDDPTAA
jgi:hypothetical protein